MKHIFLSIFLIPAEGKGDVEKVQERVGRIQQLSAALRGETQEAAAENSDLCQQVTLSMD